MIMIVCLAIINGRGLESLFITSLKHFKIILNRAIFNSQKYKQLECVLINEHISCGTHKGI